MYAKKISGIVLSLLCLFILFAPVLQSDGNAGVGVMNVPPNFANIRILQQENSIRVYLTLSDYNSWLDIYKVTIILEEKGAEIAKFIYKQHEEPDTFDSINKFYDNSGLNLLNIESCDVSHSYEDITVADRCHLNLRFVFQTTYFSQLHIIAEDRAGDSAETFVEYYAGGDAHRDSDTLLIPWIDGTIKWSLPPYLLDMLILFMAILGTVYIGKKSHFSQTLQKVFYETK
jgi:hypothetical protein